MPTPHGFVSSATSSPTTRDWETCSDLTMSHQRSSSPGTRPPRRVPRKVRRSAGSLKYLMWPSRPGPVRKVGQRSGSTRTVSSGCPASSWWGGGWWGWRRPWPSARTSSVLSAPPGEPQSAVLSTAASWRPTSTAPSRRTGSSTWTTSLSGVVNIPSSKAASTRLKMLYQLE